MNFILFYLLSYISFSVICCVFTSGLELYLVFLIDKLRTYYKNKQKIKYDYSYTKLKQNDDKKTKHQTVIKLLKDLTPLSNDSITIIRDFLFYKQKKKINKNNFIAYIFPIFRLLIVLSIAIINIIEIKHYTYLSLMRNMMLIPMTLRGVIQFYLLEYVCNFKYNEVLWNNVNFNIKIDIFINIIITLISFFPLIIGSICMPYILLPIICLVLREIFLLESYNMNICWLVFGIIMNSFFVIILMPFRYVIWIFNINNIEISIREQNINNLFILFVNFVCFPIYIMFFYYYFNGLSYYKSVYYVFYETYYAYQYSMSVYTKFNIISLIMM